MVDSPCSRVDPEVMFPAPSSLVEVTVAKSLCRACPFRNECLEWALSPASRCDYGIFGGLTEDERKALVKAKKLGKAQRINYGPIPPRAKRLLAA
ncbi:WhiB family transcriptional regulator [Streptomyces griseofuscus]|uniref:WhiB family transcriptional regulator n=1 Tax=Streptomyces griseofuscus TaxID=146922 RepID=UPI0033C3F26A